MRASRFPGFSGMIPSPAPGRFISLPDNGFGAQNNSADFVLGFYEVTPHFKTVGDGTTSRGPVTSTASRRSPILIICWMTITSPTALSTTARPITPSSAIPVDPVIKSLRLLTGADFDVESIARMEDGTFWVGEEFGPYLLHFDAQGHLLSLAGSPSGSARAAESAECDAGPVQPAELARLRVDDPQWRRQQAVRDDGSVDPVRDRQAHAGDLRVRHAQRTATPAGRSSTRRTAPTAITGGVNNATNIFVTGDMTHIDGDRYMIIERDDFQGPPTIANPPRQKKLYLFDLNEVGSRHRHPEEAADRRSAGHR